MIEQKIATIYELLMYELFKEVVKNVNKCSRLKPLREKLKVNRETKKIHEQLVCFRFKVKSS